VVGIAVSNGNVFVAGYYYNTSNKKVVCLWTNGGSAVPISDTTVNSEATAITVSGGTVYISGFYELVDSDPTTSQYQACYWEGTTKVDLPQPVYLVAANTTDVKATAITVSDDGHVYVAGDFKTKDNGWTAWKACYWEDTNTYTILDGAPTGSYAYGHYTSAIALDGTDIYVAGWYTTNNGGDGACYWKNGAYTKLSSTGYPYTSAMTIIDGIPYFGGGYTNVNADWIACLWEGTVRTNLNVAPLDAYIPSSMEYQEEIL
jgi:archaellum component FlaF (FlaF/FlaG flagellin family)